jgi:hypothetical protein
MNVYGSMDQRTGLSDPDILLRCPLAAHIPRIEHAAWLD